MPRYGAIWPPQRSTFRANPDTTFPPLASRSSARCTSVCARLSWAEDQGGGPTSFDPCSRPTTRRVAHRRSTGLRQLLAEEFIVGRVGSGTYVAPGLHAGHHTRPPEGGAGAPVALRHGRGRHRLDGRLSGPARHATSLRLRLWAQRRGCFPFEQWRRILHRRARDTRSRGLDYGPAAGSEPCAARSLPISGARARSLRAIAGDRGERLTAGAGSDHAGPDRPRRAASWSGNRGYQGREKCSARPGAPPPSDRAAIVDGLDPADAAGRRTPGLRHPRAQPTGAMLPAGRRQALLQSAHRRNAVIVEDDYDGEFRYEGRPLESLQGLDTEGRVVYVGTFSRTIFSALRIGYLIVPGALLQAFTAAKWLDDRHTATLEQEISRSSSARDSTSDTFGGCNSGTRPQPPCPARSTSRARQGTAGRSRATARALTSCSGRQGVCRRRRPSRARPR